MASEGLNEVGSLELPWLYVDTLAEFERCPNAGRIAFMRQGFEKDRDLDRMPNLGYMPKFDYTKLLERAEELLAGILKQSKFLFFFLIVVAIIRVCGQFSLSLVLVLTTSPVIYVLVRDFHFYLEVRKKIEEYKHTVPKALPESSDSEISIHWWELVKSGFDPQMRSSYSDVEYRFGGRPWRLLVNQHDREMIPVIRHFQVFENEIEATDSYKMHLTFCSLLIEKHESTEIKWGLVVDSKSLAGIAIPITKKDKKKALLRIKHWQEQIGKIKRGRSLEDPPWDACRFCPLAFPKLPNAPTVLGREVLALNVYSSAYPLMLKESRYDSDSDNSWNHDFTDTIYDWDYDHDEDEDEDNNDDWESDDDQDDSRENKTPTFREWMRDHPSRHSECGDVFKWAPYHRFWEVRENRSRARYQEWLKRRKG